MTEPLKCVTIDDEPLALQVLQQFILQLPELQLVKSFTDAVDGAAFLEATPVDLLFVDINMPDIRGTDLVKRLARPPMVIFTTAYRNYAVEGFELNAVDYLVKPVEFSRFERSVQKAVELHSLKHQRTAETYFVVRSEYNLVRINVADIDYIESVEDYLKVHTSKGKPVMTLMTMKAATDKLPASQFVRIHRSYIVPMAKIKSYLNRKVTLQSGTELPVSNSYVDDVRSRLQ